jgi:RNA polymerase sigma-70 factor, ECF subfamily
VISVAGGLEFSSKTRDPGELVFSPSRAMLRVVSLAVVPPSIPPRVRAAIDGDETATRDLLTEILPRVRNLVRYLVRGDEDVDDIAQDALVAVLEDLPGYRGEGRFEAWVDRIVARLTIARIRKRRFFSKRDTQYNSDLMLASGGAAADEYLHRREMVQMLDELPIEQRHVLVLHHALDLTVPEMAEELGVPIETVRSRLRLAKARLLRTHASESAEDGGSRQ